jgi:hypothetical protein
MPYKDLAKRKEVQARYATKPEVKFRKHLRRQRQIAVVREWLQAYKKTLRCSLCPETHPACLDFHHLDAATKVGRVSNYASFNFSIDRIKAEIAKCVVLCANCHRKHHSGIRW